MVQCCSTMPRALLYLCIGLSSSFTFAHGQPPVRLDPTVFSGSTCPSVNHTADVLNRVRTILLTQLGAAVANNSGPPCSCTGTTGNWTRVAHLDMTDPNQQCPYNWTLVTGSSFRGCGRTTLTGGSCDSAIFPVNQTYSSVCGRVIAYQKDIGGAFYNSIAFNRSLERSYLSGVSITHGSPGSRQHIWSFAGAIYEEGGSLNLNHKCPCTDTTIAWPYQVPSFVGNRYFCDTGKTSALVASNVIYVDDPLWDGQGCGPKSTCCSFNSPPWFCTSLPEPTRDYLELRLCYTSPAQHEDKLILLIDVYVQ